MNKDKPATDIQHLDYSLTIHDSKKWITLANGSEEHTGKKMNGIMTEKLQH
jgi:hypothetical protein